MQPDFHRKLYGHLAKAVGCRALIVGYRRTPEHPYPAQLDDATAAYRWLLAQGIAPGHCAFAGDSSGGGLAISAQLAARRAGLPLPAASMTLSAWTDMTLSGDSYVANRDKDALFRQEIVEGLVQMFLGLDGDRHDPFASPLFADLAGLPPIYLQAGEDEGLLDDSRQFAARARQAGVDVRLDVFPGMLRTFQMTAGRAPEADDALQRLAAWARPKLGLGAM